MQRFASRVYSTVSGARGKISKDEFTSALGQIWPGAGRDTTPIAMAISGGVDSMALAAMMRRYIFPEDPTPLHAFVVDHGLREESAREASWVKDQLQGTLGIKTRILSRRDGIEFNGTGDVRSEMYARNLRYGLLQDALARYGIRQLLIAHHANDQHETFLYRLSQGHRRGLTGINRTSPMQRFWHHESRTGLLPSKPEIRFSQGDHGGMSVLKQRISNGITGFGDAPVTLLRPLFDSTKARLRATCEALQVEWVEDPTNHEKTHTARNAIRHIVGHHKLPAALELNHTRQMQERLQAQRLACESRAAAFKHRCKIDLDGSTGRLLLAYPMSAVNALDPEDAGDGKGAQHTSARSSVLRQCLSIVTDHEVPLRAFDGLENILTKSRTSDFGNDVHAQSRGGFRFYESETNQIQCEKFGELDAKDWKVLVVERAPIEQRLLHILAETKQTGLFIELPLQFKQTETETTHAQSPQTQLFHYWDNRYWIRASLVNLPENTSGHLLVRPLAEKDLVLLKATCEDPSYVMLLNGQRPVEGAWRYIKKTLKQRAPGKLRFTLPVIEYVNPEKPAEDMLLALPTFGLSFSAAKDLEPTDDGSIMHSASTTADPVKLDFETRFKHVEPLSGHDMDQAVRGP